MDDAELLEAFDHYCRMYHTAATVETYSKALGAFSTAMPITFENVTIRTLDEYLSLLRLSDLAERTVNSRLVALKSAFKFWTSRDYLPKNPSRQTVYLRIPNAKRDAKWTWLSIRQYARNWKLNFSRLESQAVQIPMLVLVVSIDVFARALPRAITWWSYPGNSSPQRTCHPILIRTPEHDRPTEPPLFSRNERGGRVLTRANPSEGRMSESDLASAQIGWCFS
jgi:hypothetical protein